MNSVDERTGNIGNVEKLIKGWLSIWLYIITVIGGILGTLLFVNWSIWELSTKLAVMAIIGLVFHILEEWRFPGGFHYMYNMQVHSDLPDRYPMDELTDMITNFFAIVFGCVCLACNMPYIISLMWFVLAFMEVILHTQAGFQMKKKYIGKGKQTIYAPGLATSWCCFLPISIGYIISFFTYRTPTVIEAVTAIFLTVVLAVMSVSGVEWVLKSKDSKYPDKQGKGYFQKFE